MSSDSDFEFIQEARGSGNSARLAEEELNKLEFYDELITSSQLKGYGELIFRIMQRVHKDNLSF